MGSSGGGMSQQEIYAAQKQARLEAEKEIAAEQAKKEAKWQKAADNASVTTEGGDGDGGALSEAGKKKKTSTLAGSGEATFSAKTGKLGE